ncbi:MAG: S8 family serine peptidase, partial [Planctomycetes bacterium]|nr:S8 family serine peptidase [Planctomycetota bacterium]
DAGQCPHVDSNGHGTHVAGTAGGNGLAPNPYADYSGIAPNSDLIIVKGECNGSFSDDDVINGANYIFERAQALNRAAVINMSLGGHFSPHDGTSLYEQALSGLTGSGRIIVAAAGNEGNDLIHLGYQVDYNGSGSLFMPYSGIDLTYFDVWYSSDYSLDVGVAQINPGNMQTVEATDWIVPGQLIEVTFSTGQMVYIDATETNNPQNGDSHILMAVQGSGLDYYYWGLY